VQYLYNKEAGVSSLELTGDAHKYIFKVRRHKVGEEIYLRNLDDDIIYKYRIYIMDKRTSTLILIEKKNYMVSAKSKLHIGWCIIDVKNIEKMLPSLNEIGVDKITFIYCNRSQKSFKVEFNRLNKILLNSSQQSGRSTIMKLDIKENLNSFIEDNPDSYLLNFSENILSDNNKNDIKSIVIGSEGGLTDDEVLLFNQDKIVGLNTALILKSESAVSAIASKILI